MDKKKNCHLQQNVQPEVGTENKELSPVTTQKKGDQQLVKAQDDKDKLVTNRRKDFNGSCPITFYEEENDGKKSIRVAVANDDENVKPVDRFAKLTQTITGTKDGELALLVLFEGIKKQDFIELLNTRVQVLSEGQPKDSVEARLISQELSLWERGMKYLSLAENADMIPQADFYMKSATKLLRLRNETIEMLNRYRRGGEQRVVVQHVNVNDGGQAIVGGQMFAGGGGLTKN